MTDSERQAILNLCIQAALADGTASPGERAAIQQAAGRLQVPGIDTSAADLDLRSKVQAISDIAQILKPAGLGPSAYEMAASICAVDGSNNPAEQWFLEELRGALEIPREAARDVHQQADSIASAHSTAAPPILSGSLPPLPQQPQPIQPATMPTSIQSNTVSNVSDAEINQLILNSAIFAGGLELLPHTLATMAIVPVQMRMVYRIGKSYGYELDSGHIKDFLATVGVGLASQMIEGYAERAARGLLGSLLGGFGRSILGQAAGSGVAFASTYALGQAARQYYAGGRRFSAIELRSLYDSTLGQAQGMQSSYIPQMRAQAGKVNLANLASSLKF